MAAAEEGVELADQSGDAFWRLANRAYLANALHQAGRLEESGASFREAEAMWEVEYPSTPRLSSLSGYQYCDLLLGRLHSELARLPRIEIRGYHRPSLRDEEAGAACPTPEPGGRDPVAQGVNPGRTQAQEVLERARQTLEWGKTGYSLLSIALDHLTLGRAHFALALSSRGTSDASTPLPGGTAGMSEASDHLNRAVDGLRKYGSENHLPRGLLARAAFRRATADLPGAQADLDEAEEIAERGRMLLHLADVHLERTRLDLARGEDGEARRRLGEAKRLVEECGYGRRTDEVAELASALGL